MFSISGTNRDPSIKAILDLFLVGSDHLTTSFLQGQMGCSFHVASTFFPENSEYIRAQPTNYWNTFTRPRPVKETEKKERKVSRTRTDRLSTTEAKQYVRDCKSNRTEEKWLPEWPTKGWLPEWREWEEVTARLQGWLNRNDCRIKLKRVTHEK